MVKNKWEKSLFVLPFLYFSGWFRGTLSFVLHDYIYIFPSIVILFAITYLTVWMNRLRNLLSVSDISEVFLNLLVISKVKVSVSLFIIALIIAELTPLIAYPFIYMVGVFVSIYSFSKYKRLDAVAVKGFLLKNESSFKDLKCYQLLNGELVSEYTNSFDNHTCSDDWNNGCIINPATGLPMIGGVGGVDVNGDTYGVNSQGHNRY